MSNHYLFLALFVLTGWIPVQAQVSEPVTRLFPLEVGDWWEFSETMYEISEGMIEASVMGREKWMVEEVSGTQDELTALIRMERLTTDGSRRPGAVCRMIRRTVPCSGCPTTLRIEVENVEGECTVPTFNQHWFSLFRGFGASREVLIGGTPYAMNSYAHPKSRMVQPGKVESLIWLVGVDLGIFWLDRSIGGGGVTHTTQFNLMAAQVGGASYGIEDMIGEPPEVPAVFSFDPPYPNPFASTVTFIFQQPRAEPVVLEVFDIRGRRVLVADIEEPEPGRWIWTMDGRLLARGTYLVRATVVSGASVTRRITRGG